MTSEGLKSLFPIEDISVMGIWELLPHLYTIKVSCVLITTLLRNVINCVLFGN